MSAPSEAGKVSRPGSTGRDGGTLIGGMVGRTYLESAVGTDWKRQPPSPVAVLARWGTGKGVIRNVAIRRASGEVAIRPFRGLRRVR